MKTIAQLITDARARHQNALTAIEATRAQLHTAIDNDDAWEITQLEFFLDWHQWDLTDAADDISYWECRLEQEYEEDEGNGSDPSMGWLADDDDDADLEGCDDIPF